MGYIPVRHLLNYGEHNHYKNFSIKYNKFYKLNM